VVVRNLPSAAWEPRRRACHSVVDGDARDLPFLDDTFDVVASSLTLHNISGQAGRAAAVREIARVQKPGGRVMLLDFQHTDEYERVLRASGTCEVARSGLSFWIYPPVRTMTATKRATSNASATKQV
jgi:arsenite methyltransferase